MSGRGAAAGGRISKKGFLLVELVERHRPNRINFHSVERIVLSHIRRTRLLLCYCSATARPLLGLLLDIYSTTAQLLVRHLTCTWPLLYKI